MHNWRSSILNVLAWVWTIFSVLGLMLSGSVVKVNPLAGMVWMLGMAVLGFSSVVFRANIRSKNSESMLVLALYGALMFLFAVAFFVIGWVVPPQGYQFLATQAHQVFGMVWLMVGTGILCLYHSYMLSHSKQWVSYNPEYVSSIIDGRY